ncbi:uncharacterized protein LOC111051809 [Nilaparvata lugens]|uniref:uncharacterized protein LOC111051809 n=1 Tax=Nilaparvata lugens TaxID=108931 RepID=UPI00193E4D27|nr:uncharacterized protein LOC111051809 [Nilaparvata lugens]XP_039288717.1 uncharacterized protein LOC111051809 [Nilaparvata lugens]
MGCGSSKSTSVTPMGGDQRPSKPPKTTKVSPMASVDDDISISARTSQGLAFEVPLDDDEGGDDPSLIKKHPPKRLQRLEDQPPPPNLTHEMLEEKLAEAEQRRQQILNQRIQSAKARQKVKRSLLNNEEANGNDLLLESMNQDPSTVAL